MNGSVLEYSVQTNSGMVSGDDGNRYGFVGAEWKDQAIPHRGMRVDFVAAGNDATAIYRAASDFGIGDILGAEKTRLAAGLLAIFLGWAGVHKFYLGINRTARIQLMVGGGGFVLSMIIANMFMVVATVGLGYVGLFMYVIGFPALLAAVILGLVEGFIYLGKSDEDFERIYVVGKKEWL